MVTIRRFAAPLLFSIALLAVSSYLSYFAKNRTEPVSPGASSEPPVRTNSPPGDSTLANEIDHVIDESNSKQARWGVFVMSLSDSRVLYSRNGDELFTPASNMKVYTTAVALDLLGADYRWRTSVYAAKQSDSNGIVQGDLILYGRGAPDLISLRKGAAPSLIDLADQLYAHGIREVHGNVVGDSSYFRGELFGLGWQWNDLQWYYGAEPSALSVDGNAVNVVIAPGGKASENASVRLERGDGYLRIVNNTTTVARSAITTIGIDRGASDDEVRVWGEIPLGRRSLGALLAVRNPALWAATLFKQTLVAHGIKVDGDARSRDSRGLEAERFDPAKALEVAAVESKTLGEVVRETNKESNNLFAELILRTLGKEKGHGQAEDEQEKKAPRGDDESGVVLINSWLKNHEIDAEKLAIRDGSGLSRLDLVTPESTARLLAAIARTNSANVFHDSLPIAGRDGTLGGRLSDHAGRIFAKTGTVIYVHSLSGYGVADDGTVLAFSIFCNDAIGRANPVVVIDQIAGLIADSAHPSKAK